MTDGAIDGVGAELACADADGFTCCVGLMENCTGWDGAACAGMDGDAWAKPEALTLTMGMAEAVSLTELSDGDDCPPAGRAAAVIAMGVAKAASETELSPCTKYTAPANRAALIASKPNTKLASMDCLFDLDMPSSS